MSREQYQELLVPTRKTRRDVTEMCRFLEVKNVWCNNRNNAHIAQDAKDQAEGTRGEKFERLKEQAANKAADEAEKKQQQEQLLQEVLENQEPEAPTNMVGGYMVYQQNDNCELREGDLEAPWKEKFDEETGRKYFKNTEEKFTTWVDPRTHKVRPHDPSACEKGWLPFGWDKAETESGVVFFIDHLNNTLLPRSDRSMLRRLWWLRAPQTQLPDCGHRL